MPISEGKLKGNKLITKYRSKEEQNQLAKNTMRQVTRESASKAFKQMLDKDKKREADRRKQISNRSK